jgi:uncharacterized membrane protein
MALMIVLRLIHIFAGVFWAGSVFFVVRFLLPALRASGPAGGQVMQQVAGKLRYPVAAGVAGMLTILSGAWMYWRDIKMSSGTWASSAPGITYGIGALAAISAITVFATVIGPTGNRMLRLGATIQSSGGPPTADQASMLQQLQARMAASSRIGAAFLAIAVLAMAIARYV